MGFTGVAKTTTQSGEQKVSKTLIDRFSFTNPKHTLVADVIRTGMMKGACKPWNDITSNNELSSYSIELSVQMGVSTGPP